MKMHCAGDKGWEETRGSGRSQEAAELESKGAMGGTRGRASIFWSALEGEAEAPHSETIRSDESASALPRRRTHGRDAHATSNPWAADLKQEMFYGESLVDELV